MNHTDLQGIGPYDIEKSLGQGGMAKVYLGVHRKTGKKVAVKVLSRAAADDKKVLRRFQREFDTCAAIENPNVVRVFDWGTHGQRLYYTMEYLPHPNLETVLDKEAPLPIERAARFIRDVARAFATFHPKGVIHRDIKPANLIIARGDRMVLVDFGMAKDLKGPALTSARMVVGTLVYMSPEMFRGDEMTAASDVFQLGLVAYEMLAGKRAFEGETSEILHKLLSQDPPPLREIRPEIPEALAALVERCLAKDPADRFQDASEMVTILEPFCPPEPRALKIPLLVGAVALAAVAVLVAHLW